jgi:sirohydrochlorin cobaltochelatase
MGKLARIDRVCRRYVTGMLLVGHGTRDEQGQLEFIQTAGLVAERLPSIAVEAAFLELATPHIDLGMARLLARGVERLVVVPMLLFPASHAKQDIPEAVEAACAGLRPIPVSIAPTLGCHTRLLDLSVERFREAIDDDECDVDSVHLIVVGRGSSDERACDETRTYARLLAERLGVRSHEVAFVAMARPGLPDALSGLRRFSASCVVVQPHLLYAGDVLRCVREQVHASTQGFPHLRIRLAAHLGPAPQLVDAVTDVFAVTRGADTV